jgi:putative transposase
LGGVIMIHLEHFIFTPKYRRSLLADRAVAQACEDLIRSIAAQKQIGIHAIAVMPDHVHVFAELPRTMSVAEAAHLLKWFSSLYLRRRFPALRQMKAFWGHRYFYRSVGGDARQVRCYIQLQVS